MAGSIVQAGYTVDDSGGNSTTIAVTLTGVAAGNNIVAHAGWGDGTGTITASCSDGSAYSVGDAKRRQTTDQQSGEVFYRENSGGGSVTVTVTFSTTTAFRRLRVAEISGVQTSSSLDQATGQPQTAPGTTANAVTSGASSATTNATDFVMGFVQDTGEADPGTGTMSAGTGFTVFGANRMMALERKSVSSTGAQTATFTQSTNFDDIAHVVAFKESGGAAAVQQFLMLLGVGS